MISAETFLTNSLTTLYYIDLENHFLRSLETFLGNSANNINPECIRDGEKNTNCDVTALKQCVLRIYELSTLETREISIQG